MSALPSALKWPAFPAPAPQPFSTTITNADINLIANYIWGICDDVFRDLYIRGKYRYVVLPMTVLRRLDVVLEGTNRPSWT